jgi:predicted PurR-regulated permease PerM
VVGVVVGVGGVVVGVVAMVVGVVVAMVVGVVGRKRPRTRRNQTWGKRNNLCRGLMC